MISFSTNFNNKLFCKCFTTLRPGNYRLGDTHDIELNGQLLGKAEIIELKEMEVTKINNWIAYLDTGYPAYECLEIINRMYKGNVTTIKLLLLKYTFVIEFPLRVRYEYELESGKKVKETFNLNALESGMPHTIRQGYEKDGDPITKIISRKLV